MKFAVLMVLGVLAWSGPLRAQQVTGQTAVAAIPESLRSMRDSLEQLEHSPKPEEELYLSIFSLMQAADEYTRRNDPMSARFLYDQAAAGLEQLAVLRPNWEPKLVGYRIRVVQQKLAALPPPSPTVKPSDGPHLRSPDGLEMPKGSREFEFNGQKYYLIPLGGLEAAWWRSREAAGDGRPPGAGAEAASRGQWDGSESHQDLGRTATGQPGTGA